MKSLNLITCLSLSALNLLTASCAQSKLSVERSIAKSKPALYTFESGASGFNTKNFFYDNGEEVVAFDTQFTPGLAQASIDFLRTKTSNPITYVVVTHPNPDKFNGMSVFQAAGAKVVMSDRTANSLQTVQDYKQYYFVNIAKMFTNESYPKLGRPDVIFNHQRVLELQNGEHLELNELANPGVSSNQTVAFIPAVRTLIVGDLIHANAHAWLEGGIVQGKPVPTLGGWVKDLQDLDARFAGQKAVKVYGGRGEAGELHALIKNQIDYLRVADRLVSDYVKQLGSGTPDESVLQKQFEVRFPTYQLSYMIGYGAYGLVDSKR